ncbi:MAG: aldehyde dehydrogenase family protein, partial [Rhizobiales bacterium]|nr:aldehyde dehydrogenase family protein [Hyphomicrobiales bacterium]
MQVGMLFGSKLVTGEGEGEAVLDPRTGATIVTVPEATPAQVNDAVDAADRAFGRWSRTTPAERAALLLRLADRIEQHADELAALEAGNCGKPKHAVLRDETPAIVDVFRFFAGACRVTTASAAGEYLPGYTSMIRRDPIGVVGSIAPWNYPLMMAAWKLGPALAAGNTVVIKPSEQTPLTTLRLAELAADILPEGVLNVVVGRGATTGDALINHPKVAMLSLTGSIATGHKVLEAASRSLKRTHLELGGKAPVIVFDDADIDAVVEGVRMFGYYNAGQDCTAACRIYAGAGVYDRLVAGLSDAAATIAYDRVDDSENEIPPLIS